MKEHAPSLAASRWSGWDLNSGSLASKSMPLASGICSLLHVLPQSPTEPLPCSPGCVVLLLQSHPKWSGLS